jgi:hypothetical protein
MESSIFGRFGNTPGWNQENYSCDDPVVFIDGPDGRPAAKVVSNYLDQGDIGWGGEFSINAIGKEIRMSVTIKSPKYIIQSNKNESCSMQFNSYNNDNGIANTVNFIVDNYCTARAWVTSEYYNFALTYADNEFDTYPQAIDGMWHKWGVTINLSTGSFEILLDSSVVKSGIIANELFLADVSWLESNPNFNPQNMTFGAGISNYINNSVSEMAIASVSCEIV